MPSLVTKKNVHGAPAEAWETYPELCRRVHNGVISTMDKHGHLEDLSAQQRLVFGSIVADMTLLALETMASKRCCCAE